MADDHEHDHEHTPPATDPAPTPTPEPAPTPVPVTPAPPPAVTSDTDLRDAVKGLTETVSGLVTVVAAQSGRSRDESPGKVPWTHRGGRR